MRVLQQPARRGVTCLVESNDLLLFRRDDLILLFKASDDAVDSIEEVLLVNLFLAFTSCHQRSLVTYIGNVCTREARSLLGQEVLVDIVAEL